MFSLPFLGCLCMVGCTNRFVYCMLTVCDPGYLPQENKQSIMQYIGSVQLFVVNEYGHLGKDACDVYKIQYNCCTPNLFRNKHAFVSSSLPFTKHVYENNLTMKEIPKRTITAS